MRLSARPLRLLRVSRLPAAPPTPCHPPRGHRLTGTVGATRRDITTIAFLAAAAIASVPASAAAAPALRPPVVKESFAPLACPSGTPTTTVQMEGCAEQQIVARDRTITALNQRVFVAQRTEHAKQDFVTSNARWLGYRRAFCQTAGARYADGTEQPVVVAQCEAKLDAEHITDLRLLLEDR